MVSVVSLLVKAQETLGEESPQPAGAIALESPLQGFSTGCAAFDGGAHCHMVRVKPAPCADPELVLGVEQLLDRSNG